MKTFCCNDLICLVQNPDCLILTALTQTPTQMPDPMIADFCRIVCETLKNSGNVLVPCFPSGQNLGISESAFKANFLKVTSSFRL